MFFSKELKTTLLLRKKQRLLLAIASKEAKRLATALWYSGCCCKAKQSSAELTSLRSAQTVLDLIDCLFYIQQRRVRREWRGIAGVTNAYSASLYVPISREGEAEAGAVVQAAGDFDVGAEFLHQFLDDV